MDGCTVARRLEVVRGSKRDYETLSRYHYRGERLGPYAAIFALKGKFRTAEGLETVGVIVYTMPVGSLELRNVATGGAFAGLDRSARLELINKNIRAIARVVIEPRFRSLGLAVRLVKETMPLMDVAFIEAMAVMGQVNPFFEKAGMTRFDAPATTGWARLTEAFSAVGIEEQDLIDPRLVQEKLDALRGKSMGVRGGSYFIEGEMTRFLEGYGKRRLMKPGIERTRFILSKLADRPVYYFWKNPAVALRL